MRKSKKYRIKQKDFRKLEKLAERVYNTVTVIDYFCRTQQESEELYNLTPIVENLRQDTDTVNAYFINYPIRFAWLRLIYKVFRGINVIAINIYKG